MEPVQIATPFNTFDGMMKMLTERGCSPDVAANCALQLARWQWEPAAVIHSQPMSQEKQGELAKALRDQFRVLPSGFHDGDAQADYARGRFEVAGHGDDILDR